MVNNRLTQKGLIGAALAGFALVASASGFQIQEQDAAHLGLAYAGTAALSSTDASTSWYNPAGLTQLDDKHLAITAIGIHSDAEINLTRATSTTGISLLQPGKENKAHPGGVIPVGSLHYAARFAPNWGFGLSLAAPFGLVTDYDETSYVRYVATKSELRTVDISPSIAYRYEMFSFAVGPDFVYGKAKLNGASEMVGAATPERDTLSQNELTDWTTGWHVAAMFHPSDMTKVGLSARSRLVFHGVGDKRSITGSSETTRPVRANISTPETVTLSGMHHFTDQFALAADIAWTKWDRFKTLTVTDVNNPATTTYVYENFKNTMRYALGLIYHHSDCWDFRVGFANDDTPTNDRERTMRIPDEDRTWAAVGFRYNFRENFNVDFGYAHLFFKDAVINDQGPLVGSPTSTNPNFSAVGTSDASANIVGLQFNWIFS